MTDETGRTGSVEPYPGNLDALQELVDDLIKVDVSSTDENDSAPLDAEFRVSLQDLVTVEMKRDGEAPSLQRVLTAALAKWAAS